MNKSETESNSKDQAPRKRNLRQLILFGILLVVLGGYLYDRFYLFPDAEKKIQQAVEDIAGKTHPGNQQEIHELVGFKPSKTYQYQGYEIEQYRFPRGLPLYPRPVLDIAFKDGTIAFFSQVPMDEDSDALKEKMPKLTRHRWASDERENINLKAHAIGGRSGG